MKEFWNRLIFLIKRRLESKYIMGFEYYKDKIGEWRWRLRAVNHKIVAHGEGYKTKRNVLKGIHAVILAVKDADTKEVRK